MTLIIIGPDAARFLPLARETDLSVFESVETFDRWRKREKMNEATTGTIAADVESELAEMGCAIDHLDGDLRCFFQSLSSLVVTTPVKDLVPEGISESTFYRRWRSSLPGTPKQFLTRVRVRHALRLVSKAGLSVKEAAWRAGFASTWHFRQAVTVIHERYLLQGPRAALSQNEHETRE
jgi:hypothetical protein